MSKKNLAIFASLDDLFFQFADANVLTTLAECHDKIYLIHVQSRNRQSLDIHEIQNLMESMGLYNILALTSTGLTVDNLTDVCADAVAKVVGCSHRLATLRDSKIHYVPSLDSKVVVVPLACYAPEVVDSVVGEDAAEEPKEEYYSLQEEIDRIKASVNKILECEQTSLVSNLEKFISKSGSIITDFFKK